MSETEEGPDPVPKSRIEKRYARARENWNHALNPMREFIDTLAGPDPEGASPVTAPDPAPLPSPPVKLNIRGGLKDLAVMLLKLENEGTIDHVTDKQAAELFTVRGAPVNPDSLKSVRNANFGGSR